MPKTAECAGWKVKKAIPCSELGVDYTKALALFLTVLREL